METKDPFSQTNFMEYCLQAVGCMGIDEIRSNSKCIKALLRNWFNKHYASAESLLADNIRRSICWVDEALNMEEHR